MCGATPYLALMPDVRLAPDTLIACPHCDALHVVETLENGERALCCRCHTVLIAPRESAFLQVITLSLTAMILMVGAVFFPFLRIEAMGLLHESSIFGAAMAFSGGILTPLSFAVLMSIVLLPVLRFAALIYTLGPLAMGRAPWPRAAAAFRLAEGLRPWSMAEIFIIGTAVALVKVAGIATIALGPAFWAFAVMLIVVALKNTFMCKWTIWTALEQTRGT